MNLLTKTLLEERALPELLLIPPCSLEELSSVKLLDRVDTKYVVPSSFLHTLLSEIAADYQVLELKGHRLHSYETLYFDTADLHFFNIHQRGMKPRRKVRVRRYGTNQLTFLEHKYKRSLRTKKKRIGRADLSPLLSEEELLFLKSKGVEAALEPSLWVRFQRVTLRALDGSERCTIDCGLEVEPYADSRWFSHRLPPPDFSPMAIVEIKQSSYDRNSSLSLALRKWGYRPGPWSKYTMGCALSFSGLKSNRLKPQKMLLDKLQRAVMEVA